MKKEDLLKIFKIEELYNGKKDKMPFLYHFTDNMNINGTNILYYFYEDEIKISLITQDFSTNNEEKKLHLKFQVNNDNLTLIKNENDFKNEFFPHLIFEDTLEADLEFVSGVICNVFIPKHNLKWEYSKINY